MADATGIPAASVALYVRHLRESGLIESGAHGVNARSVTYMEAARLLIALLVTDKPSRSSQVVQDFGKTQFSKIISDKEVASWNSLWQKSGILEAKTFEEAVATAIQVFADQQDSTEFEHAKIYENFPLYLPRIDIGVQPSDLAAFIRLDKDLMRFDHAYVAMELKAEGTDRSSLSTPERLAQHPEYRAARDRYHSAIKSERWVDQDVVDDIASVMGPET